MEKPPSGLRTDLTVTVGPVYRSGEEESRRAPDGGTAENAGVTWERVDAEDGGLRACPSVDRLAAPRLLERRNKIGLRDDLDTRDDLGLRDDLEIQPGLGTRVGTAAG